MFVEASRMDGEGQLTLTGQLGNVMKESAHLAISWLRSNAKKYHLTKGEWPAPGWGQGWGACSKLWAKKSLGIMTQEVSHSSETEIKESFKGSLTP